MRSARSAATSWIDELPFLSVFGIAAIKRFIFVREFLEKKEASDLLLRWWC
jgi:hypothetical protein